MSRLLPEYLVLNFTKSKGFDRNLPLPMVLIYISKYRVFCSDANRNRSLSRQVIQGEMNKYRGR